MTTGVVIGKFLPPHAGHHHLIDTGIAAVDRLTVFVCERPEDSIPGALRAAWLRERHPAAGVRVVDDRYDENDSRAWATNTLAWMGGAPDVVFTSEDYGERYAALMGARHVLVDRARIAVPCSGTAVRADPYVHWRFLTPPVRAWYARRVCVVGAGSTGTTTLARALASHYATPWVAEYGRDYSVVKQARGETAWSSDEFTVIAREQCRREELAARDANRVLICDTDAFATTLWHRRYLGSDSAAVAAIANARRRDLYLLTGDEIPFVQDGLRDGEHIRSRMHEWFVETLGRRSTPWRTLRGSHVQRMREATVAIDALFAGSAWRPGRS